MSSTAASIVATREIEAGPAPTRFARGWHCLGLSRDFSDGHPHRVRAFGQQLVVFAGSDGTLHVLDGYCRHMGADLSEGEVKGDEINVGHVDASRVAFTTGAEAQANLAERAGPVGL